MKRTKAILLGVVFLSVLAVASCGSKKVKKEACKEGEKMECCAKKDSTAGCEKKCEHDKAACDSTKKTE